ncbi:hypothetical protein NLI96_g7615 [Meripilus lineatus]|uniref:Uncharacterized protein n=1 Tax=Meripilus lineatus TaxID=2056292 RepID=A0AAD5YH24_9APHY|nr:hypothetical protein NLI96_g7615 [Physisporinus lineatus]
MFQTDIHMSTRAPNPMFLLEMHHLVEIELKAPYGLNPKDRGWERIQGVLHEVDSRLPELDKFEAIKLNLLSKPDNIPKRYLHHTGEQWRKESFLRVLSVIKTSQEDRQYRLDVEIDGNHIEDFSKNNDEVDGLLFQVNATMVT